ncbi:ADP-ribosylglycohydrolase family protein [Coraliomargarita sp. W4R53]
MNDFSQRRAGLLFGSFIADALSLGVHWIYDTVELSQKFGYVSQYHAPGFDSYHPKKRAGEQSHVGDQALCLAACLVRNEAWDASRFMQDWLAMWPAYGDYFDHATKATLQNIEDGKSAIAAGSDSEELAGAARIAPLLAFLADRPEAEVVAACVEQTLLTHASESSQEATAFLAIAGYRLMHGGDFEITLKAAAPSWALQKAESVLALDAVEAIGQLGQSCPIASALPAVIYLALKHGNDLPKAFSENAMAGGDNCARGLALGLLLGATHGDAAIPHQWKTELLNAKHLNQLIEV